MRVFLSTIPNGPLTPYNPNYLGWHVVSRMLSIYPH